MKERLGLPKRAQFRHISKAISNGQLIYRSGFDIFQIIYKGFIYIFALDEYLSPRLITTYNIERNGDNMRVLH